MGFECSISCIPKFGDISEKNAVAAYNYAQFVRWTETEPWCREQIKNGHTFLFEEYASGFTEKDLPPKQIVDKYISYIKENSLMDDVIESWCSIGRIFDDEIIRKGMVIRKEYTYLLSLDAITQYKEEIKKWLDNHDFVRVEPVNGVRYNNTDKNTGLNDTIILIPIDGIEVEDEEGNIKRLMVTEDDYSGLYIRANACDDDKYFAYKKLYEALDEAEKTDFDDYIVIYERSF